MAKLIGVNTPSPYSIAYHLVASNNPALIKRVSKMLEGLTAKGMVKYEKTYEDALSKYEDAINKHDETNTEVSLATVQRAEMLLKALTYMHELILQEQETPKDE